MGSIALEEYELMRDSKYRVFVQAVDKALKSFEYTSEWADLISALGKLNKVLVSHTKFPVIPRRIKISKRLAQCMHPALPSGVHLKALETYDIIFKCMGTNRLSHELFIYSAGLFPLLGHAAMNVRPSLLTVYETHFVPLGKRLGPGLSGFLSGVLPGLEEGSDHFERTNALLEKVCEGVGPSHFYGCLWDCLASNAAVRLPAISFALAHYDKRLSTEDQLHVMGTNVDIMVNGLCACVEDTSVLVQRCALDLLLVGFPMHNSQLLRCDMVRLVTASLSTILRRDMSLNRRLYAWLLGSEINIALLSPEHPLIKHSKTVESPSSHVDSSRYFETYSRDMLVQAIKTTLDRAIGQNPHDLRPYRLLVSLLDKHEIGSVILDDILYEVFRLLYLSCNNGSTTSGSSSVGNKSNSSELIKSANLLFGALVPRYLWQYVGGLFANACSKSYMNPLASPGSSHGVSESKCVKRVDSGDPSLVEVCVLTEFLLDTVSLETYSEAPSEHLPSLFLQIVTLLTEHCDTLSPIQTAKGLQLCAKILTRVQPAVVAHQSLTTNTGDTSYTSGEQSLGPDSLPASTAKSKSNINVERSHSSLVASAIDVNRSDVNIDTVSTSSDSVVSYGIYSDSKCDEDESNVSVTTGEIKEVDQSKTPISDEQNVLEQCLRQYEKFYVKFVYGTRLKVGETKSISVLLESLKIKSSQVSSEERAKQLENLLRAVLEDSIGATSLEKKLSDGTSTISLRRAVGNAGTEWIDAMKVASRLLVELSTLQTFFQSPSSVSSVLESDSAVSGDGCIDILPEWLRVLVVCACWLSSAVSLQLIAISTLLDLVTLCRTAQSLVAKSNVDHQGVTPVLILPLLTPAHLRYIEHHTNVFQVIAHRLWGHLGSLPHRVRCIELLHQLQSALPTSDVVEDCLGEALSYRCQSESGRLSAFRRFSLLWHIGREVNARLGNSLRVTDIFYKSMLKMLDNLQLPENSCLKVEAQNWLLHSLLRGDIHRILDPILMMLLDPATARLSVLHVRIQQHDEPISSGQPAAHESQDKTTKIYAISSVDGNIIYHVSEKCRKGAMNTVNNKNGGKMKRIFAVTSLAGQDSSKLNNRYITEKRCLIPYEETTDSYQTHSKNLSLLQNISVFVNPFSTDSVHRTDIINTDFDDYFEDQKEHNGELVGKAVRITNGVDLDKNKSKSVEGSDRLLPHCNEKGRLEKTKTVHRNNSFSSLDREVAKSSLNIINPTLKLSSIDLDLLNLSSLSDSIFMRISDGESVGKDRKSRGSISSDGITSGSAEPTSELVRSWSFPEKDHQESGELEESTPAEEYFSGDTMAVVEELLAEIVDKVALQFGEPDIPASKDSSISEPSSSVKTNTTCGTYSSSKDSWSIGHSRSQKLAQGGSFSNKTGNGVDHLHSHLLLYCGVYDSLRTLYALQTLRNILTTNSRAFLCAAATTGLPSRSPLLKLLARHRKSIFGRGFSGDLDTNSSRSSMYLEVLISTCLYYMRSYYPNLGQTKLTQDEISGNRQVQISSVELLSLISCELCGIVRDSGHGLACYLADLMSRVKLQRILLHCVLSTVQQQQQQNKNRNSSLSYSFTQEILTFNEDDDDAKVDGVSRHSEAFQIQLLRFLLALLMLEREVNSRRGHENETAGTGSSSCSSVTERQDSAAGSGDLMYVAGRVIPQQPMFLAAITKALEQHGRSRHSHTHWTALVTCALPYLGSALTKVVTTVVRHICSNIEALSKAYTMQDSVAHPPSFPADYAITQVEALTVLCHYCLLDSSTPFNQPLLAVSGNTPAQIFSNLMHVFMPSPISLQEQIKERHSPQSARTAIVGSLPRVIDSVAVLWQALVCTKERESENVEAGSPRVVRQQLLEFLSPIALHHGNGFLAAVAVVWRERRPPAAHVTSIQSVLPVASEGQQVLVQLLSAIKAMPIDTLVQTLHQVVKQLAPSQEIAVSVEVSSLELFLHYVQLIPGASLVESWPSLMALLKEGPSLSPPAQFLLLGVLSQFVHRCPPLADKKDQKDLQDITAKLVDSCSQIAGACLEQTTWLRRNLAVKEEELTPPLNRDPDRYDESETDASLADGEGDLTPTEDKPSPGKTKSRNKSKLKRVTKKIRHDAEKLQIRALHQWFMKAFVLHETNVSLDSLENSRNGSGSCSVAQYSVSAQTVLAQLLAPLLDVAFGSQEKERVVNILTTLMYNVTPYLKNHSQRNVASFCACSQLLASLTSFQYTRKAWKKDAMDLLLDPMLFQMEARSLSFWRTTVDNLMSQDTATFRDLLSRVNLGQGNSLNLFSSREQEYEQRAQLLKRLAFVILCSEKDQFHKHMPDIQERLAESLRLPQVVPGVQAQVFLCFRVLLLRMSSHHVTSLWPIIVSEMVQVMLHMEHELSTDSEEFRRNNSSHIRFLSALDWSWVVNSNNGLHANGHPHWLQLQLAAAKLLLLAVQLPADSLPQFQMYRWAFVESQIVSSHREQTKVDFIPHVTRIAQLMDSKFGVADVQEMKPLLPPGNNIHSAKDLHPFFTAMSNGYSKALSISEVESEVELDFLEPIPTR